MEPQYEMQRYNEYYSHSAPRYMSISSGSSRNNYYNYPPPPPPPLPLHPHAHAQQQQQYYGDEPCMPPPLPPHKPKKKSMLKSPLTALKNAIIKTTRPLRRMNSMVEPERKPSKSALKRQHSMLEREMQRPYYPDEYPTYPAGFEESPYQAINYRQQQQQYYQQHYNYGTPEGGTYQNLGPEDIYGNIDRVTTPYEHPDDLYANRALIDLERRQAEAVASGRNGKRIVRRHSTTTADRAAVGRSHGHGRYAMNAAQSYVDENGHKIHVTNNYGMQMERAPNSEIMSRRRFHEQQQTDNEPVYQTRREMQREMQRHHLYQSKQQMQQRIQQGKREMEREMSSHSCSSHSEERASDERESVLSCPPNVNRDIKELREQIYQTRRETLESMAEPIYVASSKREMPNRPEPIYECKEESIMQSRENETDEKKEEVQSEVIVEINHHETNDESDLQQSSDTIVEAQQTTINARPTSDGDTVIEMDEKNKAPLVQSEDVDDELCLSNEDEDDGEVLQDQIKAITPKMHISQLINKQNVPPPPIGESAAVTAAGAASSSQMSISTQASLPVGPPNATSTPYTSNMSLPVAGPVATAGALFPALPREPNTTRGVFDSSGGTLCDPLWNVSLQIPAGAIASGVKQEIYFTVSDPRMGEAVGGPPLDMENGLFCFFFLCLLVFF